MAAEKAVPHKKVLPHKVEEARLAAAEKNGDIVALRALDRVREAAFARGEIRTRRPDAGQKAREMQAAAEEPLGDTPWSPGPGYGDVGSGPRPSSRDPHPIDQLMSRMVRDRGWAQRLEVASVVAQWDEIVGPNVAQHLVVESFDDDGVLTLRASSSSWETQIRMLLVTLEAKIAAEVGDGVVKKIVLRGPDMPAPLRRRYSAPTKGVRRNPR